MRRKLNGDHGGAAALGAFAWLRVVPLAGSALLFWTGYRLQHGVLS